MEHEEESGLFTFTKLFLPLYLKDKLHFFQAFALLV